MKLYIGTKRIQAQAMTRAAYNTYRGWELPADEDGADAGYLVEYQDGGQANHPAHAGYISWSPADVFEAAYREAKHLTFGEAIELLKLGHRVTRSGWNGVGMWLALTQGQVVPAEKFWNEHNKAFAQSNGGHASVQPYITMKTAKGLIVPWLASQGDMLDEDWMLVP
jgi:hypothetical protein